MPCRPLVIAARRAAALAATIVGSWFLAAGLPAADGNPPVDEDRQARAFAAFERLPAAVELPAPGPSQLGAVPLGKRSRQVDLGPLPVRDLVGLSFRLAAPEETSDGTPFEAEIVPFEQPDAGPRWEIRQRVGRVVPGERAGSHTLATLAERDGRTILEVEPAHLASRGLTILRRCVIVAEALNPTTRRLAVREIRLVTPTKVRPLVVGARDGPATMAIPVPAGIGSRDVMRGEAVSLKLPVSGVELEAVLGGRPVSMRWPRPAGGSAEPGAATWTVPLGTFEDGTELGVAVTLSLPRATLESLPYLRGPLGQDLDQAAITDLLANDADGLNRIEKRFRARVEACPLRAYERSSGQDGPSDLVRSWLDAPLATEEAMVIGLPGHETARLSLDLYLQEEYARVREELAEAWRRKLEAMPDGNARTKAEYFGAPLPQIPRDFAAWEKQWRGAKAAEWEAMFVARLDAWSEWFWRHFKARWGRNQDTVEKAFERTVELRIVRVTSIARDAQGVEYRVPLVVSEPAVVLPDVGAAGRDPPPGRPKEGNSPRGGDVPNGPD